MLKSINLSLSSACGADCIFCPKNRGQRIKQKIMPFEIVEKILEQIVPERVAVGENGDALLNPDFIKILRFIKSKGSKIVLSTNFQNFTKDKIEIILNENLIDELSCNIDGLVSYYQIKKLDLDRTLKNLTTFLELRKDYPPLRINVIPYNDYLKAIRYNLGAEPIKIKYPIKTTETLRDIKQFFKGKINPEIDIIEKLGVRGWAEREQVKNVNHKKYICKELNRIKNEAFIAPDGTWYACCLDSNNELVLGNVMQQSINEIFNSDKRKNLIQMLENREFDKIGSPCNTVNCCQRFKKSRLETIWKIFLSITTKIKNILN